MPSKAGCVHHWYQCVIRGRAEKRDNERIKRNKESCDLIQLEWVSLFASMYSSTCRLLYVCGNIESNTVTCFSTEELNILNRISFFLESVFQTGSIYCVETPFDPSPPRSIRSLWPRPCPSPLPHRGQSALFWAPSDPDWTPPDQRLGCWTLWPPVQVAGWVWLGLGPLQELGCRGWS